MNEFEQLFPVIHNGLRTVAMSMESGFYLHGDDQPYQPEEFEWIGEPFTSVHWEKKKLAV